MRRLLSSFVMVAVLGAMLSIVSIDAQADPVQVRTSTGNGYGRMTFNWPQPVGHQALKDGDRLVINFSRPIEADLRQAVRALSKYIVSVQPAPNATSVVFRIRGDFSVRSYDSGSSVVVDIVTTPSTTSQTSAASPASNQGPKIPVRTGVHDDFTRVVFDWPRNTAFEVVRDGSKAIIKFAKPGTANVSRLARGRIRNVIDAQASTEDGNLQVELSVDATSQIKAFASGPKVVIDIYRPGTRDAASTPASAPVAKAATASQPASEPQRASSTPEEPPTPAAAPLAPVQQAATKAPNPETVPLSLEPKAAPISEASNQEARVQTRAQASQVTDGVVVLKFNWDEPVGAAVFRRGENLWVVFDKRADIDTEALLKDGAGLITAVEQVPSRNGAVLR
ncbi:MAG: hypothetical protein JKY27_11965, partial [Magnetovibrio sp.]|nr:hypothetical protein [Magnetovibrio sp.]